jgi:hypothetical protein
MLFFDELRISNKTKRHKNTGTKKRPKPHMRFMGAKACALGSGHGLAYRRRPYFLALIRKANRASHLLIWSASSSWELRVHTWRFVGPAIMKNVVSIVRLSGSFNDDPYTYVSYR